MTSDNELADILFKAKIAKETIIAELVRLKFADWADFFVSLQDQSISFTKVEEYQKVDNSVLQFLSEAGFEKVILRYKNGTQKTYILE